jgi:hypothetical protein
MPRTKKAPAPALYSVHPGVFMVIKWVEDLKAKTGRTLDGIVKHIVKSGPEGRQERVAWLKAEFGLNSHAASWLAQRAEAGTQPTWDESEASYLTTAPKYVEAMFAGPKAALLPAYHALLEEARALGSDVRFCPCKTIVPFYRNHVFAEVKPATRTRIDFGLALGDTKATGKLIDTGGFKKKDRITHRIPISSVEDIDAEVRHWLKVAYDRDG